MWFIFNNKYISFILIFLQLLYLSIALYGPSLAISEGNESK